MKKQFVLIASLLIISASASIAQTASRSSVHDKNQSIIIRKSGGKKEKITVVIDGDKITVNGKPMEDYKDGNIEITENNNEDMNMPAPPMPPLPPHGGSNMFVRNFSDNRNDAFLGVASKSEDGGATVEIVTKDSPADKAGLKKGDVITKVGSDQIDDAEDLVEAVGKHKPADKVSITYTRDAKENTATATLEKNKNHSFSQGADNNVNVNIMKNFMMNWNDKPGLGIRAQDMENGSGVKLLELNDDDAPAAKAGLKEGDVITGINSKTVQSIKDIKDAMKDVKPGNDVSITYQRSGIAKTVSVHLPKPVETSDL